MKLEKLKQEYEKEKILRVEIENQLKQMSLENKDQNFNQTNDLEITKIVENIVNSKNKEISKSRNQFDKLFLELKFINVIFFYLFY